MLFQFTDEACQRDLYSNDFHSGEALCREVTLLCRKYIELHAAYLIHTCTMNYIAAPTKNVSTLELKKKNLTEYLTVKKNRDRKALPHLLEFYKREYSSNTTKRDSLNLFEGPCRTRILPLQACTRLLLWNIAYVAKLQEGTWNIQHGTVVKQN